MKRKKRNWKEVLGDALLELILSALLFGIGALILLPLGILPDDDRIDPESVILLGFCAVLLLGGGIFLAVRGFKKKNKTDKQENKTDETQEQKETLP